MAASSGRNGRSPIPARPSEAAASPSSAAAQAKLGSAGNGANDAAVWKRLKEAGFDEESIRRRDKAALIAYVAKLEGELYDYQHNMGLLLLERKDWDAKYEQAKAAAELAETTLKREQATHASVVSGIRKSEESLKKALGVEKECVVNLEKALHEIRKECAEIKFDAETRLVDAHKMVEEAEKKCIEANSKQRLADSLQEEASRYHSAAERKLKEVEAREDELRRRYDSLNFDFAAKDKAVTMEREQLYERQKAIQQEEEKLFEKQTLLTQREQLILNRSVELEELGKETERTRLKLKDYLLMSLEEKSNLQMKTLSHESREKELLGKEKFLDEKEKTLLTLQAKLKSKEFDEIQRLKDEYRSSLENKKAEIEAELELKRNSVDNEIEAKRHTHEQLESKLRDWEKQIKKSQDIVQTEVSELKKREADLEQKMDKLHEKEEQINATKVIVEKEIENSKKEKDNISHMKAELEELKSLLKNEEKRAVEATENLKISEVERDDLLALQIKLKEEIDGFRIQRVQLMAEAEELKAEKEKFETEWQLIDEKSDDLQEKAMRIVEERKRVSEFLKDERDNLKLEKDSLQEQFMQDVDSRAREHEEFINKMNHEHTEWISKIQLERADFIQGIEQQKRDLEDSMQRKHAELERELKKKEYAFESEKAKELEFIDLQKIEVAKDWEHVALEMKRLEEEKRQIVLDREKRENEWKEISDSIHKLETQRERLQEQRESLQKEKVQVDLHIKELKNLEALKGALEKIVDPSEAESPERGDVTPGKGLVADCVVSDVEKCNIRPEEVAHVGVALDFSPKNIGRPPSSFSTPLSWLKKCAHIVFKPSPDKDLNRENNNKSQVYNGNVELMHSNNDENTQDRIQGSLCDPNDSKIRSLGNGSIDCPSRRKRNGSPSQDLANNLRPVDKKRKTGQDTSVGLEREDQTSPLCVEDGVELCDQTSGDKQEESGTGSSRDGSSSDSGDEQEESATGSMEELCFKMSREVVAESCGELELEDNEDDVVEEEQKTIREKVWTFLVT